MKDNHKLLVQWVAKTIAENPTIIEKGNPANVYAELYKVWIDEVQLAMKEMIKLYGLRK